MEEHSPATPTLRAVQEHVERECGISGRGKKHTVTSREKDIDRLVSAYQASEVHINTVGREVNEKDIIKDVVIEGVGKVQGTIDRWAYARRLPRSTMEDYDDVTEGNEGQD